MEPMVAIISTLILLVSSPLQTHGLIAYDCDEETSEITTVSLRDVAECPKPELTYKSETMDVKVLQRNEIKLIKVQTCLIEISRIITHCGMHSHSSMVAGGLSNYVQRIGAEECRSIHRYGTFKLYQHTIGGIKPNSSSHESITLLGQIDATGTCQGTMYQERGQTWNDVVLIASVKIQIQDHFAMVKLSDNEVKLSNDLTCPFLPGYCFDAINGETVWDGVAVDKCESQFSTLYEGKAERVTNSKPAETIAVVEQDTKIFALTLIKKVTICNLELWQTEHPRILLMDKPQTISQTLLLPQNVDLMSYINSKFLYVEQAYKITLETVYLDTVHRRCLLQREILKNRLLMAPTMSNVVSQLVQEQEGYVGRVLGEVLYIMKCVPRVVKVRRDDRCFNELPIEVNNQSKFMSPITHIIQNVAEEVDCNSMTPPLYFVNNEWIGMAPLLTVKHEPQKLEVAANPTLNFTPIMPLGESGIYSQEEARQVQRILTFGSERKAVQNMITRRVVGLETQNQGMSPLQMFNPDELKDLARSTIKQLWGWFSDLGTFTSGILGFYLIFKLAKYLLGVIINGVHLYKTFGGGVRLIACVWNTLTMWLIHHYHTTRTQNANDRDAPNPDIPDPEAPNPESIMLMPRNNVPPSRPILMMERDYNISLPQSQPNLYRPRDINSTLSPGLSTMSLVNNQGTVPSAPHWSSLLENDVAK